MTTSVALLSQEINANSPNIRNVNSSPRTNLANENMNIESNDDSIKVSTKSTLDTIVKFQAKDTLLFNLKTKTLRLKNKAKLDLKAQNISSDLIILNFENSTLEASADTTIAAGSREYPKFSDAGQSFVGSKIFYNFDTKQGTVSVGETEITDGYYYGSKIKRISDDELFVQDGCYTNCNHPHPHYYFGSPKMKMKMNDKIYVDPIIVYVEDLPIAALPIGIFFPIQQGKQSGLILPTVNYSPFRGMLLENFGYYFALSEYYDTRLHLNFYTKGGFLIGNQTNWSLKNVLNGNFEAKYGYTRNNPDDEFTQNWNFKLNHQQTITPQMRISANIDFMTSDFNRKTSNNIYDRSQSEVSSNASFSHSFDNGISYSLSFRRSQNIINDTYRQNLPSANLNIPTLYPLKNLISPSSEVSWLRDLNISYSSNASFDQSKSINISKQSDTSFKYEYSNRIVHNPSISISPKLGYFTLNPYIQFNANNYFRSSEQRFNEADSTIQYYNQRNGFFTEYNYSIGANISTTLWGVLKTNIGSLSSLRHQFKPSIGYSFSPDLSQPNKNMYGEYYNSVTKQHVKYSRFALDGGGIASQYLQNNLNFSFDNTFSITLKQDSGLPKKIDLLRLSLGSSYNFTKDSVKLGNINANFSTPPIANFNFNGNANFSLYEHVLDSQNRTVIVDNFLLASKKGLAYFNGISLNLSTSFSNQGFFPTYLNGKALDSLTFGERFTKRINENDGEHDMFGDNSPGYDRFSPPWQINLSLYFTYSRAGINHFNKSLNLSTDFTFNLTPTWHVSCRTGIDFITGDFSNSAITVTKQLHCWNFYFEYYPIGVNRGFYFRLSPNAQILKDLKIESPRRLPLDYER